MSARLAIYYESKRRNSEKAQRHVGESFRAWFGDSTFAKEEERGEVEEEDEEDEEEEIESANIRNQVLFAHYYN